MFKTAVIAFLFGSTMWAQITVQFSADPTDVPTGAFAVGPFPSNVLTVPDPSQITGLRANLPPSEDSCSIYESSPVCSNVSLLNQLDGFSINPRLMVCFSGLVDTNTLAAGVDLVSLPSGAVTPINQIFFDPLSHCAFAKPNNVLNQASNYLLLIGNEVHDAEGQPVVPSATFTACTGGDPGSYCTALRAALNGHAAAGGGTLVAASLFTTMDATSWLENARVFVDRLSPFAVPAGVPSTFALSKLRSITWLSDRGGIPAQDIPLSALAGVDSVSFGLYQSPNYLAAATISVPANSPLSYSSVSYHVFLPRANKNAKIPVVIYGHGLGDNQFGGPTYMAADLARNGFATLAIEFPGHGFGPGGRVNLTAKNGSVSTVLTPGRGTPGATIGPTTGCISLGPIGVRDCGRQAAVDLAALVHAIVATGGLGLNLDPNRIYYVGQSFGATVGTLFTAVEPAVPTSVLNGAGGSSPDIARLAITGRPLGLAFLASVGDPSLFNVAPLGPAPPEPYFHDQFNDNYPFKDQPPLSNEVPQAPAIQAAFEAADWMGMSGDPLAFAPHLKLSPLQGVPPKKTLFQLGFGDLEVPNPTESAVVLAAGGQADTSFLHFESAAALQPSLLTIQDPATPGLPILPHRVLSNPTIFTAGNEAELSLALAEQQQAADFFQTYGSRVTDPNAYLTPPFAPSHKLYETPVNSLPEGLNFLQIPR